MKRFALSLILLFSFPSLFAQEKKLTATDILNRYIQAVGGETAWRQIKTVHSRGKINHGGLLGNYESWSKYPGKNRLDINFKKFEASSGSDGENFWEIDPNWKARRLGSTDAKIDKLSSYISDPTKLADEKEKISVALAGEEADPTGGPGWYIIKLIPEGLDSFFLFINKVSFLRERAFVPVLSHTTTWFFDYRRVGGVLMSFKQRQISGGTMDSETEVTFVEINPDLSDTLFAFPREHDRQRNYFFSPGAAEATIPFEVVSNQIRVKVVINDSITGDFILDSGASANVLSSELALRYHLPLEGKLAAWGIGGEQEANVTKVAELKIDGLTLTDQTLITSNLAENTMPGDGGIYGVLGYDLFNHFVIEVNYDTKILTIYDPTAFTYSGPGEILPLELVNNLATIKATLDGEFTGFFILDTGTSFGIVLNAPFIKNRSLLKRYPKRASGMRAFGLGGMTSLSIARLESLELGSLTIKKPIVGLRESEEKAPSADLLDGVIGHEILKRFKVVFNYPDNKLVLEKGEIFESVEKFDRSGLVLGKNPEGNVFVAAMLTNSPAEKSGLKPKDKIIEVNGKPAKDTTLEEVRELLMAEPGSKIKIKFSRKGKQGKVELTLKELL